MPLQLITMLTSCKVKSGLQNDVMLMTRKGVAGILTHFTYRHLGDICMKDDGKSRSTQDNKCMAMIHAVSSGGTVSSAGCSAKGETPTKV
jgi:hypothetical protein